MSDLDELALAIRQRQAILFIGAGVSMSVGLPSWSMIVRHMAEELDVPESLLPDVTYQTLAEFYRLRSGSIGPLRSWMDRTWRVPKEEIAKSRLYSLIVELDFPLIYTTNYDRNLEAAFDLHGCPYDRIANARDIAASRGAATQIVKFHGDFDDDNSLVLAETDYFNRLYFDAPLDVKFMADALGRTVLFIGYSMSDINIRLLLHRLWQTWQRSGHERDRPRSFVFMPEGNVIQETVLGSWGITLLSGEGDDPGVALTAFMSDLKHRVERLAINAGDSAERKDHPRAHVPQLHPQPASFSPLSGNQQMSQVPSIQLNDGNSIPQLGFGVWQVPNEEASPAVAEAIKAGYRLIDTAQGYDNEEGVGEALRQAEVGREALFVTTKLRNGAHDYDEAIKAFERSAEKLGLDYLDMFLIHWPVPEQDKYVDAWRALVQLRKDGRVRSIGVSNFLPEHIERIADATGVLPVINQVELHPQYQQRDIRDFHTRHDIALECYSPLGSGAVLDNEVIAEIAEKHGRSVSQIILRWELDQGLIVIPKSTHAERIRENIDVFGFALDEEDRRRIDGLDDPENGKTGSFPESMNDLF